MRRLIPPRALPFEPSALPWAFVFGRVAANAPRHLIDAKDVQIGTQTDASPNAARICLEWAFRTLLDAVPMRSAAVPTVPGLSRKWLWWQVVTAIVLCSTVPSSAAPPELARWFPTGGQRGTTLELKAEGTLPDWPISAVASDPRIALVAKETKGVFEVTIAPEVPPGLVTIRLHGPQGASVAKPWMIGGMPEVLEAEPNNGVMEAQSIASLPAAVSGRLEKSGDVDLYRVALTAGQQLVVQAIANRGLDAPLDSCLELLNTKGLVVARNHDSRGLDPMLVFIAPEPGEYLVRLYGFPSNPDSTIGLVGGEAMVYRLLISTGPWIDAVLPLALSKAHPNSVQPVGWNLPEAITATPRQVDPQSLADQVRWHPDWAEGYSHFAADLLPYPSRRLEATATVQLPQAIEPPVMLSGQLGLADQRLAVQWPVTKESRWRIHLESQALGLPVDGLLELWDAEGKRLVRQDDGGVEGDPKLDWKSPFDGVVTLRISDLFGHGSAEHLFRVSVLPIEPSFRIHRAEDLVRGEVGKPVEIAVEVERRDGWNSPLEISVEGLPEGMQCPPVRSENEGDSAKKVVLQWTSDRPLQQAIRVVAKPAGPPD
ncbi:MAG: PPC domain-containing protein, partial [Pirellulaceae bacterium]